MVEHPFFTLLRTNCTTCHMRPVIAFIPVGDELIYTICPISTSVAVYLFLSRSISFAHFLLSLMVPPLRWPRSDGIRTIRTDRFGTVWCVAHSRLTFSSFRYLLTFVFLRLHNLILQQNELVAMTLLRWLRCPPFSSRFCFFFRTRRIGFRLLYVQLNLNFMNL